MFSKKRSSKIFLPISKKGKQIRPSQIFRKVSGVFLHNFKNKQIPTIVGTDADANCTIWGFSNIKSRGEDLLAYCVSADLNFCNVGNKPTFRTKTRELHRCPVIINNETREEVLDLSLVNRCAWDQIVGWHVSNVLSFSNHMYIILLF